MPLKVSDGIGAWIDDFKKSKDKRFKGHSDKKRRDQAIAAYLSAKDGPQKESVAESKVEENPLLLLPTAARLASRINPSTVGSAAATVSSVAKKGYDKVRSKFKKKKGPLPNNESSLEYAKSIEKINKKKRDDLLKPGEKEKMDKIRDMMKKANENVRSADRKPEVYTKPDGKRGVRMVPTDREVVKKEGSIKGSGTDRKAQLKRAYRSGEHSTDRFYGDRGRSKANTIPKPKGMKKDKNLAKAYKAGEYADQSIKPPKGAERSKPQDVLKKPSLNRYLKLQRTENVKEGMTTGNEAGMMFRVKIEGLPDMIMVGRSPSDIKQQLRKIVKQPSMITSVDRMPKSQVRKMYRDLAGGKDIDENHLPDYGSPESVKKMSSMTPGQKDAMLDKLLQRRKGKSKKQLGKNDNAED